MSEQGYPVKRSLIKELAGKMAMSNNWFTGFLERHRHTFVLDDIKEIQSARHDPQNIMNVETYIKTLTDTFAILAIPAAHIVNVDVDKELWKQII